MRIVTRPDFDGIVCAAMILEAQGASVDKIPVIWLEPSEIQHGRATIQKGDIVANLPFAPGCSVWFDHHISNEKHARGVEGLFRIAPSAAGLVYEYYRTKGMITRNFDELIRETDIIDAALLDRDQVLYPERHPYLLLSMSIKNRDESDIPYWNRLVGLLRDIAIDEIHKDEEVARRCRDVVEENRLYGEILKEYTTIYGDICVTDFRTLERAPSGNRFLQYCLFPECIAGIKIRYHHNDPDTVLVSIGRSLFKEGLNVNIGRLLAGYGGGGHAGAGGCSIEASHAQEKINEIIELMKANRQE
ncbi:MAG: exopolyphosphatase [Desulfamplus sp.]|nr:exopolyphosphatase [Desulfamplus sp.]